MINIKQVALMAATVFLIFAATSFAETDMITYKAEEIGLDEKNPITTTDSSNLDVNVVKYRGYTQTTVFTGKLKDYDCGKWVHTDFSKIQFIVIFDWDTIGDEATYIIPAETENTIAGEKDHGTKTNTAETNEKSNQSNSIQNITSVSDIIYDVTYTVSNENMNILYSVSNGTNTVQTVNIISSLYKNGVLQHVISTPLTVNADTVGSGNIAMILPETGKEECSVKMMVWENMSTIRPLGKSKTVKDIEPYLREKTAVISSNDGQEFKLYMNSENVIGNNIEADHIIKFNPHKFEVIDLCGLTYEKELTPGKIENTGIMIQSIDTQNGKIIFNFDLPEGRNTGINNIVKFRALSDVSGEEIIYEIQ